MTTKSQSSLLLEDKGAGFHSEFECRRRETKISHQGKQMLVSFKPITSKLTSNRLPARAFGERSVNLRAKRVGRGGVCRHCFSCAVPPFGD